MDPEDKEENRLDGAGQNSGEFGKVIDALHNKQKLPSLRTYQGDMAQFIRDKNESVVSITVKQKEKKQKVEEKQKDFNPLPKPKKTSSGNFTIILISLVLVACGAGVLYYIFNYVNQNPTVPVVIEDSIIPYNSLVTISTTTKDDFIKKIAKLSPSNGVNIFKISDEDGLSLQKVNDFFSFLQISLPATLERTLKDRYTVGMFSQDDQPSSILIITVGDYGQAFAGMLDWEANMDKDLAFLNAGTDSLVASDDSDASINAAANVVATTTTTIATTTATTTSVAGGQATTTTRVATTTAAAATTTTIVKIPMKPDIFAWRDLIIKNKDTRGLVDDNDKARIAYTFLDKNTILITNNLSAIGDVSAIYASRSVAR